MITAHRAEVLDGGSSALHESLAQSCWFAACTCPRHEKRVAEHLEQRQMEFFLPLYETVHRWKDRLARVQLPLFPGYIFVRLALPERRRLLEIASIVRLVSAHGVPVPLADAELQRLRKGFSGQLRAEPHPYLTIGRRVRIITGPLAGMEGVLVRRKGDLRVIVSIDLIMRSVAVEVNAADLEPLSSRNLLSAHGPTCAGST